MIRCPSAELSTKAALAELFYAFQVTEKKSNPAPVTDERVLITCLTPIEEREQCTPDRPSLYEAEVLCLLGRRLESSSEAGVLSLAHLR